MKRILTGLALTLFLLPAYTVDYDWGGQLENTTQASGLLEEVDDSDITQSDKVTLWVKAEISPDMKFYANGGYQYKYTDEEHEYLPLLSAFYLSGSSDIRDKNLDYTLGRFRFADSKGKILNSLADGVKLSFPVGPVPLKLGVGYTGLVFIDSSDIELTAADAYESSDDDALWAPPRLVQFVSGRYNDLPGGAGLFFSLVAQEDFRTEDFIEDYVPGTGQYHTQYGLIGLDGRITPELFFSVSGTLQTGQYIIPDPSESVYQIGGMVMTSLEYYANCKYTPVISVEAVYASGDTWGKMFSADEDTFYSFIPISTSSKGLVYGAKLTNLIYGDLGISVKPHDTVQVALSAITFLRGVDGPVSDSSLTEESGGDAYLGEEVDLTINWRPFSDLGMSLSSGVFFPNSSLYDIDDPQYKVSGFLSFSF